MAVSAANFTKILTELYNESSSINTLVRRLLNLPEEDIDRESAGLAVGVIAAIVVVAVVIVCGLITLPLLLWGIRYGNINISCVLTKCKLEIFFTKLHFHFWLPCPV